jgi:dTDP-4-amino-4,6-dideoxy-D-galactose acyltransferase
MEANDLCQRLSWDSDFFGLNIARLNPNHLSPEIAKEALAWSESNSIDCLYFLSDADDPATVRLAEDNAFHFMDIRITLDRRLHSDALVNEEEVEPGTFRPHEPADIPALKAIARASHHDSRFYYDPNFPEARCDDLYETWIEKSCNGYADMVLVADIGGEADGYISCHLHTQGEGQIGLVGIAARSQGKGLGQRLVNEALRWFAEKDVSHVTVVTQGRNANAQRLYQRCGFVTREVQLWYHRWFPKAMV